jgi:large subunit ribosomal protein L24
MQRIKKDDLVRITAGKDRGKEGRVLKILTDRERVVVEGHNMVTKHIRPQTSAVNPDGGRVRMEAPLHVSNVMPVCPGCDEAVRVGYELAEDGDRRSKTRVCKKCGTQF